MTETESQPVHKETKIVRTRSNYYNHGGSGAIYGLGMIGALVYYIGHAVGFWPVILAILKGIVWPAFLVYDLLKFLGS